MSDLQEVKCSKCDGLGKLSWASRVAKGDCFACKATGKVTVDFDQLKSELNEGSRHRAEWILRQTNERFFSLTYNQLHAIHDFCCSGGNLREAFPQLHSTWMAGGFKAFIAAQSEKLDAYYAANPV